jgi:glycerophosphoryl diester phosphodiesterase
MFRYLLAYYTGLLPFLKIDHHEVFALPYLTRDYLRMKMIEAKEISPFFYGFIVVTALANWTAQGMLAHLKRRGKHTNYWVVNDEDEVRQVFRSGAVDGIMSDRPMAVSQIVKDETAR